jgi:hypothetical protein
LSIMPNMPIRLGCPDAQSGNAITGSITSSYDSDFRQDPTLPNDAHHRWGLPGVTRKGARLNHAESASSPPYRPGTLGAGSSAARKYWVTGCRIGDLPRSFARRQEVVFRFALSATLRSQQKERKSHPVKEK